MPLPDSVAELMERFEANRSEYHQGHYNETQTRIDYVNPLFAALGWDINNSEGLSEVHRDVVHEDAVKIGGTTKAPDYSFRIGGARKFFVETKKPSVNLYLLESPAFQLRRYAWTVKMPLSILTSFEEFAIYDTRVPPDKKDPAKRARLDYFKYTDYAAKWDEIASRFSREAVLSGAFDRYAEEARDKRISVPVDVAFLSEISGWRDKLARNIVLKNPGISPRSLNYAVQMIIDRIIFLRISEDRGAEPAYLLQPLLNAGGPVYPRLLGVFRQADARYNSGLFHFGRDAGREEPDDITPHLSIDDRPLKEIIASVYFPESPFEFSVFPADILGQVYEQFLGKVIRISGQTAEVEDKPEVKKAGGVYYTPTYIVDYIVRNTVGKLVEGKTPAQVAKLTILDPACGSGSFLIGAYQFLLDWHLKYYTEHDRAKWAKGKNATIYQFRKDAALGEIWRLTTAEKKRILLANIYGVDIDTQAVEVTKLSLLLKVLEGESAELIDNSLKLFKERALPDLENNIKCGNSLIGPDFYDDKNPALFDMDARLKINTFDWKKGFPYIMKDGGFDAVIGNPPYIRIQTMKEWAPQDAGFYKEAYASAGRGNYDIYVVFVEKGLSLLSKSGRLGFILPHKFFNSQYGQPLRKLISDGKHLDSVVHFGDQQVFADATTYTSLTFLTKSSTDDIKIIKVKDMFAWRSDEQAGQASVPASSITQADWNFVVGEGLSLFQRLSCLPTKLSDIAARIFQGIIPGADKVYAVKKLGQDNGIARCYSSALDAEVLLEEALLRNIVSGAEVGRFVLHSSDTRVIFPYTIDNLTAKLLPQSEMALQYPMTYQYFEQNADALSRRDRGSAVGVDWYRFIRTQNIGLQAAPKIAVPRLVRRLRAGLDLSGSCCLDNVDVGGIILNPNWGLSSKYVAGLLNSQLLNFYFLRSAAPFRGGYFSANRQFIENLPIQTIDFSKPTEKAKHDKMVSLVEQMLKLHTEKAGARLGQEKAVLQQQIEATDTQIDRLVYDLYGLTEDEIKVVEAAG